MSEHTELLTFDERSGFFNLDGKIFAFASVRSTGEQRRRLVACWNVCVGIDTDKLEVWLTPEKVGARMLTEAANDLTELAAEKIELIEALRIISLNALHAMNTDSRDIMDWKADIDAAMKVADQALAKYPVKS